MQFRARLKRGSSIWRVWTGHRRVGGEIAGVPFSWVAGNDFVTGPLETTQVEILRTHGDVQLEAMGVMPRVDPELVDADAVERRSYAVPPAPRGRVAPPASDPPQAPRMRPPTQKPVPPSAWKNR